MKADITVL